MPKTSPARLRAQKKYNATPAGKAKAAATRKRIRQRNREHVAAAKAGHSCDDCGSYDRLDFHHVIFPKVGNVADMVNGYSSLEKLDIEMAKCDLLCRSCHRKRHLVD